ncbi:MAG: hypothetical protein OHK0031_11910 [Anaerolineales bacterium]
MKISSKREQTRLKQQRKKWKNYAIGGAITLFALILLSVMVGRALKPAAGEAVAIPAGYQTHVEIGSPLTYPSDPPAGGQHYGQEFENGFYDEATLPNRPGEMAGYLVHNLEHGYVIFWYNCANLDETACASLKSQIKAVMDAKNNFKLIAVPWKSIDTPLVMTSWGRLQRFEGFDERLARSFIESNLNHAPEPGAQ